LNLLVVTLCIVNVIHSLTVDVYFLLDITAV